MKYYSRCDFVKKPKSTGTYILKRQTEKIPNLNFPEYQAGELKGYKYIHFEEPREESIKKYFAHVFTLCGTTLTSTEPLDDENRTFGDTKKIGTNDLVLIQFSKDMSELTMWFIKNKGMSKAMKQTYFKAWTFGEPLLP